MTRRTKVVRDAVRLAVLIVGLSAARSSLADHYRVPSGSMQPTVDIGDRIVVSKMEYGLRLPFSTFYFWYFDPPERGDVVVLESPETAETLLKRVGAVPGDVVAVREGRLFLRGAAVPVAPAGDTPAERLGETRHRIGLWHGGGPDFGPTPIPENHFLVLGDNRGASRDSRVFGLVHRDAILGRAEGVYYRDGFTWRAL
jgi:signal peptidase I